MTLDAHRPVDESLGRAAGFMKIGDVMAAMRHTHTARQQAQNLRFDAIDERLERMERLIVARSVSQGSLQMDGGEDGRGGG